MADHSFKIWLRIFFAGMLISFLGTLPLGTLNIAAMQIALTDGFRPALYFALGALLVEVIFVRVSLVAMHWVTRHKRLFGLLEWIAVVVVAALAISSFRAAMDPEVEKNVILSNTIHRFWLGVMLSAVNPLQIPFWFGWSAVLFSKKILTPDNSRYNIYILGIGLGTLAGNMVFILGGKYITEYFDASQQVINLVIGAIFAVTAILLAIKRIFKRRNNKQEDVPTTEA